MENNKLFMIAGYLGEQPVIALITALAQYERKYGIADFLAFIDWCEKNDKVEEIAPTIIHDLNGLNDASGFFLPRTSGYSEKEATTSSD